MVRPFRSSIAVMAALGLGLAVPARAAEEAGWTPRGCGEAPAKPTLDLHDRASYNKSVDLVSQYQAHAKAWDACAQKAATADMGAISADAQSRINAIRRSFASTQTQLYAGFSAYPAEFKAAADKLAKQ